MRDRRILLSTLCLVVLFCLSASSLYAQNITKNFVGVSLKEIFDEVERQANYSIVYNIDIVDETKTINTSFNNASIDDVLKRILDSDLEYKIQNKIISITKKQAKTDLKAVVTTPAGDPLIGATVMIEGENIGVTTDMNGRFTIPATGSANLIISYLGYISKEVTAEEVFRSGIIELDESTTKLDDVIVVGYGTQKRVNLTGAVAVVNSDAIDNRPAARASQLLQGTVPNMNITYSSGYPGASASINIRGVNSISSSASPLVLIDGIEGDIDRINPNDIESVSVLKDASSAAVYGARAAYGVVLVTTKSGKEHKTTVTYSGRFSLNSQTTSTDFETRGYYSAAIADLFYYNRTGSQYTNYTSADYQELWARRNDKTENSERPWIVVDDRNGQDEYVYYGNFDWYNYLYQQNRPMYENNISISGGNEKMDYFISGGAVSQEGIFAINPDMYKVYNVRAKISAEIFPRLRLTNNTSYYSSSYVYPGYTGVASTFTTAVNHALASFVPVNPDGTYLYTTSLNNNNPILDGYSALLSNDEHTNSDRKNEFSTTFDLEYKVTDNFTLRANYNSKNYSYISLNRSVNIPYSQTVGEIEYVTTGIGLNSLQEKQTNHWYNAYNFYGDYNLEIKDHTFKFMAGANYEDKYMKDVTMSRQNLLSNELNDFNLAVGDVMDIDGGQSEYALLGLFYRVNYTSPGGKYLFETSGRYDGSSRFAEGHRFGFFPSASAGWRISEEPFFEPLRSKVDNLKLRLSYGSLGNQQVGYYDYVQTIDTSGESSYLMGTGSKTTYASVSDPNSADLTWEIVQTLNVGVDVDMFRNRFNFTADAYIRDTKGMLTEGMQLPSSYGASSPLQNAADLRTKGWEFSMTWRDSFSLGGSPLNYNVMLSLADNTTFITKYDNDSKILSDYYEGQRLGDIWGYKVDGYFLTDAEASSYAVDQTSVNDILNTSIIDPGVHAGDMKFLDLDGDNIITTGAGTYDSPGDREVIGNSMAHYTYGVQLGADWKGINFSVYIQGVAKQDWYPGTNALAFWGPYSRPYYSFISDSFMDDVWSPTNTDAYFPRPFAYSALSDSSSLGVINDKYIQNVGYCRIKNITVGYTIPSEFTQKIKIEKLYVYFSGENLFTFSPLRSDYIDPEQASSSNTYNSGTGDAKAYPWTKTLSVGVNVTF